MKNNRINKTISNMIRKSIIPKDGLFDITEIMLSKYVEIYGSLSVKSNGKFDKNFARKLAGLSLLKLKFERGGNSTNCKEGLVYLIGNPSYPEHLKVGMTVDLERRLSSYQIYDPLKRFYVKTYEFSLNRRFTEENILKTFNIHLETGEWIKFTNHSHIIKCVRTSNYSLDG